MDMPPHVPSGHDNLPLEYWKAEAASRKSWGTISEVLLEFVQLLVLGLSLPIRLPLSWWLKQRRKRKGEVTL